MVRKAGLGTLKQTFPRGFYEPFLAMLGDVWSMGCVMFEMFTNKLPFEVRGNVGASENKKPCFLRSKEVLRSSRPCGEELLLFRQAKWVELHSKGPNWDILRCSRKPFLSSRQCFGLR